MKTLMLMTVALLLMVPGALNAAPGASKSPPDAKVYIISPQDGETVESPVVVRFGLRGMGVAPAGVVRENTGHHHLMIDVETPPPLGSPIPADANHRHFGGGQTETTLDLKPGSHTLQLFLGDQTHTPHDPPVISEKITITVK